MRFLTLTLLATGTVSTAALPRRPRNDFAGLRIRGGAGPLDGHAKTVAKVALGLGGIQGTLNLLCPEANLKGYGWSPSSEENVIALKGAGYAALASAAMN